MKNLILFTLVSISFNTSAADLLRLDGSFVYKDQSVQSIREIEIVPSSNQVRLQDLKNDHFECRLINDFFKCQKFIKDQNVPTSLSVKLAEIWKKSEVTFSKSAVDPELVNESDSVLEWDIYDAVSINQERTDMYHAYLLNNELQKLRIELNNEEFYPIVNNDNQLSFPIERSVTTGRFTWKTFNLLINFQKK